MASKCYNNKAITTTLSE